MEEVVGEFNAYPVAVTTFKVYERAKHVLRESLRVYYFTLLLITLNYDKIDDDENLPLELLGKWMGESHASLRDLFECSCPELDDLVSIAMYTIYLYLLRKKNQLDRTAGAYGARLTGAGWGGSIIAMVNKSSVAKVMNSLKTEYYDKLFPEWTTDELRESLFVAEPGSAAFIKTLTKTV